MGTWGPGNFDSDEALDFMWLRVQQPLQNLIDGAIREGVDPTEPGGTDVMAGLAILRALCDQCNAAPPEIAQLEGWKEAYLARWEEEIGRVTEDAEFIASRRQVIIETFEELAQRARAFYKD